MKKGNVILTAAVLAALGGLSVSAADLPVYTLQGVTVTATRQAESLQDVPANVQVVTAKQIKQKNIQNAAQAVAMATGVSVDNTIEPSVSIRGYDSKNILVLLDGQPLNNGWNGTVDWGMIPVDNISKIEVVSGGQSALYGGRAVGGVINIMTKTQKADGVSGSVNVGYGSNNTWKQSYMVNGKKEKWTYGAFYESHITDGWRTYQVTASSKKGNGTDVNTDHLDTDTKGNYVVGDRGTQSFLSETYGFNLGYNFSDDKKLTYRYSHTNYHWEYKNPQTYVMDANGNPLWAGNAGDKSFKENNFFGTQGWRVYDVHSLTYNDQENKVHAHFGLTDYSKDGYTSPSSSIKVGNENVAGSKTDYPSKTWNFDLNKRWTWGEHTVLVGGSLGQDQFDLTSYKNIANWKDWNSAATLEKEKDQWSGGKAKSWSLYAQDKWAFAEKWTAYIGGRYDHYTKEDGYNQFYEENRDTYPTTSYDQFSPKLSLDYALDQNTNFYVSYGKSFDPPILYQLYRSSTPAYGTDKRYTKANPDLKPETTTNWEIGMKKKIGSSTELHVSAFYADTSDYIKLMKYGDINGNDPKTDYKTYKNVGEAKTHGFELALNHSFSEKWGSYLNYTWQTGRVSGDNGMEKNYDIPRHLLHTGVTYTNNPWSVTLDGMFVSSTNDPITSYQYYTGRYGSNDPYFLLNLNTNYAIDKNTSVQFGIYNLFDREYYDDEVTAGRTYNVSVRYTF